MQLRAEQLSAQGNITIQQTQTDGGLSMTGNVTADTFIGRDKLVGADEVQGDKVMGDKHEHHHYYVEPHTVNVPQPPMMALTPPTDYIQRSKEFNQLINYLLASNEKTVAITATIRGAGGFGKTTLAQAICHDQRIRTAFPDGIVWTTIGDEKANVLQGLRKLYHALTDREAQFVDQHDAATQLSSVLMGRRCLMVIDDVWNAAHLQPFLEGGERCVRLITTRMTSVIPKATEVVALDAMQVSEATKLLGAGMEHPDTIALSQLACRLGEWPLLLKLVNRRLYEDVAQYGLPLAGAITRINDELDEFGLTAFDVNDADERSQAVAASIGVSLRHLKPDAQYGRTQVDEATRFLELAIFPEDTPIPLHTLALLWQQTGNLSFSGTERLCRRLADLSLILHYDGEAATILLHDVTRHYLLSHVTMTQLGAWHRALLHGYRAQCNSEWWRLPDDGYLYQHLLWHLREAQQQDTIDTLLLTYRWLDTKLQATDIVSLIHDFDFRHDKQPYSQLSLLRHALQMSVSVLARDKDQLVSQLYGRLCGLSEVWSSFVDDVAKQKRVPWLQPKSPNLMRPGGSLFYILSGHTAGVDNLLLTPDGHLISASRGWDSSIKVWDLERGALLHSLEGHTAGIGNLLLTPDGRLISSSNSDDSSIKVWDLERGALLYSLEGHTTRVTNLLLTPAGHLIAVYWHSNSNINININGSSHLPISKNTSRDDSSIKVWDLERGALLYSLEGHTAAIHNLLLTPDGHLITTCHSGWDLSIKVWNLEQGVLLHSLNENTTFINYVTLSRAPRCFLTVGGSQLTIWNWHDGKKVVQFTTDGDISSCTQADDGTIIVGDGLGRVHFLQLVRA